MQELRAKTRFELSSCSSSMSSFADLDGLLIAALADSFTSAADLTRASRICWRLRTECLIVLERRARAKVKRAWRCQGGEHCADSLSTELAHAELGSRVVHSHQLMRPYVANDIVGLAAMYAGGWGCLLAGREGLLETAPLNRSVASFLTPAYPDGTPIYAEQERAPTFEEHVSTALVVWDIYYRAQSGRQELKWSGVLPLIDEIGVCVDGDGQSCCSMYPSSTAFPGEAHHWQHTFRDEALPGRFMISGNYNGDKGSYAIRVSVLSRNVKETLVLEQILPCQVFRELCLPSPDEIEEWFDGGLADPINEDCADVPHLAPYLREICTQYKARPKDCEKGVTCEVSEVRALRLEPFPLQATHDR